LGTVTRIIKFLDNLCHVPHGHPRYLRALVIQHKKADRPLVFFHYQGEYTVALDLLVAFKTLPLFSVGEL
jgi:hypothetical protein